MTLIALTEESSDDEDEDEARKAAVRELPKAQSLKELRLNSKHVVSQVDRLSASLSPESSFLQALEGERNLQTDLAVAQQVNDLLMSSLEDD